MQSRPEGTGETRVSVGDEPIGQTHVAEHGPDVVAGCRLSSGSLEGRDQPDAAGQEFDAHLQEVVPERATGSSRKSRLMQPLRRDGTGRG
jgi:hypothetical protein